MGKSLQIDLSDDRLIAIAADMVDEHNYIGALKMLNKNAELTGNDEDSYMLYAEIFDDLGLYEKSVNGWFKFMDVVDFNEVSDCYEGLAVGYMNLGNEHFSAYYYNKLLLETDEVDATTREEIVRDFLSAEENPLKFTWPPEIADVSEIISEGVRLMKEGEYDKACDLFSEVAEGNPRWVSARNYMAMCLIISDRNDEAEAICRGVLEKIPDNVQAMTTLAAVLTEAEKREEALEITGRLLALDVKETDDIYKIATVCCENGLHAEAYSLFHKLDEDFAYDRTILYFRAVSAFNSGKFEESFSSFDRLLTIYPDAVTARYYYDIARASRDTGEPTELSYYYRLPQEIRQSSLKMLAAYMRLSTQKAAALTAEIDISSLVKWCFDETEPSSAGDLQLLAAHVAVKAGMDDYVRDLLLHAFLPDRLKIEVLESLAERNRDDAYGVVVCNVYKRVTMRKLSVGRLKKVYFVRAYSRLVAHFAILDDSYGEKFARTAEKLYGKLMREERLEVAKDVDALTAAIFTDSGVHDVGIPDDGLCAFFNVTDKQLEKIRGEK